MLNDVKLLLGIPQEETELDKRLQWILSAATARITLLLGGIEPPECMRHVIVEAAVARYNRIGSEGLSSHTVEGENLTFSDSDFFAYSDEISAFLDAQNGSKRGQVRFL